MTERVFAAAPSRGILSLGGADRAAFLQGLVSNDIRRVDPRHGVWAALLTPQGKYLHDFFVIAEGETLLLEGEIAGLGDLRRRLAQFRLRSKIDIADATARFEIWQAWGDGAGAALGLAEPGEAVPFGDGIALLDPRLPGLGLRFALPPGAGAALLDGRGFVPAEWASWDRLRLGLGVPDGSRDLIPEKSILLENGFDELHGVAWDKGCYMGQELTARTKYRGLIRKRLMPVMVDGPLPLSGSLVTREDGSEAGEMRSGQAGLALAMLRLDAVAAGGELRAGAALLRPRPPDWLAI